MDAGIRTRLRSATKPLDAPSADDHGRDQSAFTATNRGGSEPGSLRRPAREAANSRKGSTMSLSGLFTDNNLDDGDDGTMMGTSSAKRADTPTPHEAAKQNSAAKQRGESRPLRFW